ncbi:DUF2249 domain-containing protein [Bradyrhizobium icense]
MRIIRHGALRHQFEIRYGDGFRWTYLEEGPEVWRVRLERVCQGGID